MRIGVDTGGTFTDLVVGDGTVVKVLSTPAQPDSAVADAIARLDRGRPHTLAHGTTVATNALLEHRLATTALVTTHGFADVIEIARQERPSLYDPWRDRPPPLVPRALRFEVRGRLDGHGREIEPIDIASISAIPADVDAVAVCLLHADVNSAHEQAVAAMLRRRGFTPTCSHEVSPEFREYERTVTTVANAGLRGVCAAYLDALRTLADHVLVMTSAGGLVPVVDAADVPAALLLSGPAGGVRAAAALAAAFGIEGAVSFDMGGTSTDVCLIRGGVPEPAPSLVVGGYPIRLPALDVHTIGAGGGSIARLDGGGSLSVGPDSAGADPGPAAYGRGGLHATVTDANVVAGRIPSGVTLPGIGVLDVAAARAALARAGVTAEGVIAVVDAAMEEAVRLVTVARGVDPRELALVAFGGAGPLHACSIADALGMRAVVIPPRAGVFSAVGLLASPQRRELVRSWNESADHGAIERAVHALEEDARRRVGADAVVDTALDCRYHGQSHELTVATIDAFHDEHERHNGYAQYDTPVEVVAIRARATRATDLRVEDLPAPSRPSIVGPSVVAESDCTLFVPDGWRADPGPAGAWLVRRSS